MKDDMKEGYVESGLKVSTNVRAGATPLRGVGPHGTPQVVRPPIRVNPPQPVIVVPPCKRGGPGVVPC